MENTNTENARKRYNLMNLIKWFGVVFGLIMFLSTRDAFGQIWAAVLAVLAAAGFFAICHREARRVICQFVADDLKDAVEQTGLSRCVVEIRSFHVGLVTRIYLIGAGKHVAHCGRAVFQRINNSWYRESVWVTQMVDLHDESEVEDAQIFLDEELLGTMKRLRGELWDGHKDAGNGGSEDTEDGGPRDAGDGGLRDAGNGGPRGGHTHIRLNLMNMEDLIDRADAAVKTGKADRTDAAGREPHQEPAGAQEQESMETQGQESLETQEQEKEQK